MCDHSWDQILKLNKVELFFDKKDAEILKRLVFLLLQPCFLSKNDSICKKNSRLDLKKNIPLKYVLCMPYGDYDRAKFEQARSLGNRNNHYEYV